MEFQGLRRFRYRHRVYRRAGPLAFAWVLLALASCSKPAEREREIGSSPGRSAPVAAANADRRGTCRFQDFGQFLEAFQNDLAFQRESVSDPFLEQSVDPMAEPEPATVSTTKRRASLTFPVFPPADEQAREGLARHVALQGQEASVRLAKPDTDYQFTYRFAKRPCWTLVSRSDDSL